MKDSYYFPHDYHARHDPNLAQLIMEMGCEGSGIYWNLVEMLYENKGYLVIAKIPVYAKTINTTAQNMQKVINEYNLFSKNGEKFYSKSLLVRLKHINTKRRKARASAKLSHSANAERSHSVRSAIKERKGKESKVKKSKEIRDIASDLIFIDSLKTNPAYKGIDIDRELAKMDAWLSTRPGKRKTRRFIVAWLNRIDKPVVITPIQYLKADPNCKICKGNGLVYIAATSETRICDCRRLK